MKIGSETRRQEDNVHRHLHRQADTYSEKDMIRGEQRKGNQRKERERTWKRRKYSSRIKVYNRWKELIITEILSCLFLLFLLS